MCVTEQRAISAAYGSPSDQLQQTALHVAVVNNRLEMVEQLLAFGVDTELVDGLVRAVHERVMLRGG